MRRLAIALPALGLALAVPAGGGRVEAPRPRNVVLVSVAPDPRADRAIDAQLRALGYID